MLVHSRDITKKTRKPHSSPKGSTSPDLSSSFLPMPSKRRQATHNAVTSKRRREGRKQPIVVYNNPYSSDSAESDGIVVVQTNVPSSKRSKNSHHHRNTTHHNNNSKQYISKRRRNSQTSHEIDSQLLAFLADADDGTTFEFEFQEDEEEDDDADEDDDEADVEGIVVIQEASDEDNDLEIEDDDDSDANEESVSEEAGNEDEDDDDDDDEGYNAAAKLQLVDDGLEQNDRQIEKEEEAAIVEEFSFEGFDRIGDVSALAAAFAAEATNSDSTSESSGDEDEDDHAFVESLFVNRTDPALKHIVSSVPRKYHDSDDDSFILDYFFSSGDSSDDDPRDAKTDDSGRRRHRRRRTNTFSEDVDDSDADDENGGFDIRVDDVSSGIDASIRKNGYVDADDGESTDEDENLPPPSTRKAGHRATEILISSASASKPPVLGSWILPVGRRIGVINGLATRTLSPPPFPRGEDETDETGRNLRIARDLPSSPSVMAAASRGVPRAAFDISALCSDSEDQSDIQLEEFIYMSELDDEDAEEGDLSSMLESTPGPTSTPVWAGKFNSRYPLSAFRNRSSMQYRST
ncbi:transcription factor CRF1-domain-containing protein [Kockiozyma suomiensis]|uniref:transcription factor CRF1-domain-containing protein n=1 Tax=Kockiozyma suomiensis TaxID=1337062 RepID=UPI003343929B